jgi:hypothetical protein
LALAAAYERLVNLMKSLLQFLLLIPIISACSVWTTWMTDDAVHANANVINVRAVQQANGLWTFHVTVEHPDTGWEDYADGWDTVTSTGTNPLTTG